MVTGRVKETAPLHRARSAAYAVAAAVLLAAAPLLAQEDAPAPVTPQRPHIVKADDPEKGLILDDSGLTVIFDLLKNHTRSIDREEIGGGAIEVHVGRLPTEGPDYDAFVALDDGIVEFQTAAAIKLRTPVDLRFGELEVSTGNVAEDYPGLYSLWLRKAGDDDWRLVFNDESDVWGSMHDAQADVGEIHLQHELTPGAAAGLTIDITPTDSGGTLKLAWGEHSWSAPFSL